MTAPADIGTERVHARREGSLPVSGSDGPRWLRFRGELRHSPDWARSPALRAGYRPRPTRGLYAQPQERQLMSPEQVDGTGPSGRSCLASRSATSPEPSNGVVETTGCGRGRKSDDAIEP